jgi:hypothetical protein
LHFSTDVGYNYARSLDEELSLVDVLRVCARVETEYDWIVRWRCDKIQGVEKVQRYGIVPVYVGAG